MFEIKTNCNVCRKYPTVVSVTIAKKIYPMERVHSDYWNLVSDLRTFALQNIRDRKLSMSLLDLRTFALKTIEPSPGPWSLRMTPLSRMTVDGDQRLIWRDVGNLKLRGDDVPQLGSAILGYVDCCREIKNRALAGWNQWRKWTGLLCDKKAQIKSKESRTV